MQRAWSTHSCFAGHKKVGSYTFYLCFSGDYRFLSAEGCPGRKAGSTNTLLLFRVHLCTVIYRDLSYPLIKCRECLVGGYALFLIKNGVSYRFQRQELDGVLRSWIFPVVAHFNSAPTPDAKWTDLGIRTKTSWYAKEVKLNTVIGLLAGILFVTFWEKAETNVLGEVYHLVPHASLLWIAINRTGTYPVVRRKESYAELPDWPFSS